MTVEHSLVPVFRSDLFIPPRRNKTTIVKFFFGYVQNILCYLQSNRLSLSDSGIIG